MEYEFLFLRSILQYFNKIVKCDNCRVFSNSVKNQNNIYAKIKTKFNFVILASIQHDRQRPID
jgi:hypothetical protein